MVQAFQILGIVHIGVAALIVAGYVLTLSSSRMHPLMTWSARAQLLLVWPWSGWPRAAT